MARRVPQRLPRRSDAGHHPPWQHATSLCRDLTTATWIVAAAYNTARPAIRLSGGRVLLPRLPLGRSSDTGPEETSHDDLAAPWASIAGRPVDGGRGIAGRAGAARLRLRLDGADRSGRSARCWRGRSRRRRAGRAAARQCRRRSRTAATARDRRGGDHVGTAAVVGDARHRRERRWRARLRDRRIAARSAWGATWRRGVAAAVTPATAERRRRSGDRDRHLHRRETATRSTRTSAPERSNWATTASRPGL